jgi:hypothetical protein
LAGRAKRPLTVSEGFRQISSWNTQRLNLHALLGAQRADVGSIRAIWAVQDKIALDADEEKALELKRETVAGQERTAWNADLSLQSKEFEFSDSEAARIRGAMQTWESYVAGSDRRWLQPLVEPLFPEGTDAR